MDQLINMIMEKTGLSKDQAENAAKTTINYIKDRLPSSVSGQIDAIFVGQKVGEMAGKVEGVFHK